LRDRSQREICFLSVEDEPKSTDDHSLLIFDLFCYLQYRRRCARVSLVGGHRLLITFPPLNHHLLPTKRTSMLHPLQRLRTKSASLRERLDYLMRLKTRAGLRTALPSFLPSCLSRPMPVKRTSSLPHKSRTMSVSRLSSQLRHLRLRLRTICAPRSRNPFLSLA
jgi:hypothetical protein